MKWKTLESKELFRTPVSRLRVDKCELPDGVVMPGYYVMEFPDWVNIVPITQDNQMVLIRQYRHATGEVTIEIPGGSLDPEDGSDFTKAAYRELEEETGYAPGRMEYLGPHSPNPASHSNRMHTFLARDCVLSSEQSLDPYERIEVLTKTIDQVEEMVRNGEITHSIVLGSIFRALLELKHS